MHPVFRIVTVTVTGHRRRADNGLALQRRKRQLTMMHCIKGCAGHTRDGRVIRENERWAHFSSSETLGTYNNMMDVNFIAST